VGSTGISLGTRESRGVDGNFVPNAGIEASGREFRSEGGNRVGSTGISFRTRESRRVDGNFVPKAGIVVSGREFRSEGGNRVWGRRGFNIRTSLFLPVPKQKKQLHSTVTTEPRLLLMIYASSVAVEPQLIDCELHALFGTTGGRSSAPFLTAVRRLRFRSYRRRPLEPTDHECTRTRRRRGRSRRLRLLPVYRRNVFVLPLPRRLSRPLVAR
jgi:hypothetical protein